jgi:hypothetical protein
MRRFFPHRQNINKPADKLSPSNVDPTVVHANGHIVHNTTRRIGKKLTEKNLRIGALITLIAGSAAWMGQESNPIIPTKENSLVLPAASNNATDKVLATKPNQSDSVEPTSAVLNNNASEINNNQATLLSANTQAIQNARNGDPLLALNQLESVLLNDPQAGLVFNNLRRLYAGFASQSYQLAMDPTKNQAVTVELSDAQQKYNIQIPVMANNTSSRLALDNKIDSIKMMPNLPPITATPAVGVATAETTQIAQLEQKNVSSTESVTPVQVVTSPQPTNPVNTIIENTTIASATSAKEKLAAVPIPEPVIKLPPPLTAAERKDINTAVMLALKNWSDAWSKQDTTAYLASYSATYSPKGTTHKNWVEYRQVRIKTPKFVKIELTDQKAILIDNTHVRVTLTQDYASDTLKAKDKKTLELELINNKWQITSESGR